MKFERTLWRFAFGVFLACLVSAIAETVFHMVRDDYIDGGALFIGVPVFGLMSFVWWRLRDRVLDGVRSDPWPEHLGDGHMCRVVYVPIEPVPHPVDAVHPPTDYDG